MERISINPITRLEGHGEIEIFLDEAGNVSRAYLQIPELRGFEKFAQGRPAEEMPRITPRICGVCPTAHHMASVKCLDALFQVQPPPAAKKIRELFYNMFMFEDHLLHFYYLGGPDFIVGPTAPKAERNILGVIGKVGLEIAKDLIATRRAVRELMTEIGGKVIHPVFGLPGGISKSPKKDTLEKLKTVARKALDFARFTLKAFHEIVLANPRYLELITSQPYYLKTNYMGLVDEKNRVSFYDGEVRIVGVDGKEIGRFSGIDYLNHIAEHVEPWTYIKFPYLKKIGWKGFVDGDGTSIYRVAPLARLNVSDGMKTPEAQEEYERFYETLGEKPVHHTLAYHWARVIEVLQSAERMVELSSDPEIGSPEIRNLDLKTPREGVGIVEAPRGTLIHHYKTDEKGIIQEANLIVATVANGASMNINIDRVARATIKEGKVDEGILNLVEMAFRAYDPCFACATHSLPGGFPIKIKVFDKSGQKVKELSNL